MARGFSSLNLISSVRHAIAGALSFMVVPVLTLRATEGKHWSTNLLAAAVTGALWPLTVIVAAAITYRVTIPKCRRLINLVILGLLWRRL